MVYKDQRTDVVYANAERTDVEPTGTFTLVKKNADKSANVSGAKYRVWSDESGYDEQFTTNSEGKIVVEKLKLRTLPIPGNTSTTGILN